MSGNDEEPTTGIDDTALPEDLVPSDDNPLAKGLDDGETVDDLLDSGKPVEDSADEPGDEPGHETGHDKGDTSATD